MRRPLIAVVGDGSLPGDDPRYQLARSVGREVVDRGSRLLCGGLGGVMEAAAQGARESSLYREGDTVGLLPGTDPSAANPFIDIVLCTGLGHGRNALVAQADGLVVVGGGAGTLSEAALSWVHLRPVAALGESGWAARLAGCALDDRVPERVVHPARGPEDAVAWVLSQLRNA